MGVGRTLQTEANLVDEGGLRQEEVEAEGQEECSAEGPAGEQRRERAPEDRQEPPSLEPGRHCEHHEGGANGAGEEGGGAVQHARGDGQEHRADDEQPAPEGRLDRKDEAGLAVREEESEGHAEGGE